jgi:hypothetical protein
MIFLSPHRFKAVSGTGNAKPSFKNIRAVAQVAAALFSLVIYLLWEEVFCILNFCILKFLCGVGLLFDEI